MKVPIFFELRSKLESNEMSSINFKFLELENYFNNNLIIDIPVDIQTKF